MKSLRNGTSSRFRIAAATLFSIILLYSPAIALDSYEFGEVEVGSEASVVLDIANPNGVSLTFGLDLSSDGESSFSLGSSTVFIPAGESAQVQVNFTPIAPGSYSDTLLVLFGSMAMGDMNVQLSGTGIEPVAASPADLSPMAAAMQKWAAAVASKEYKGQTIGDRVQQCFDSADNHGQAVRCVAKLASQLRKERRISRWDAWEMKDYAAKSRYHHKLKKHWMQKKADFRETREKQGRRWSNWD